MESEEIRQEGPFERLIDGAHGAIDKLLPRGAKDTRDVLDTVSIPFMVAGHFADRALEAIKTALLGGQSIDAEDDDGYSM